MASDQGLGCRICDTDRLEAVIAIGVFETNDDAMQTAPTDGAVGKSDRGSSRCEAREACQDLHVPIASGWVVEVAVHGVLLVRQCRDLVPPIVTGLAVEDAESGPI